MAGLGNCVVIDDQPFVYASTRLGAFVLPARCRHRGGPLHLGRLESREQRLVCPWHERRSSVARCLRAGIPSVRHGGRVTAVFPYAAGTSYSLQHRPLSPDLEFSRSGARESHE
jgi:hypothetical protein